MKNGQLFATNPIEIKIRELYQKNKDVSESEVREAIKNTLLLNLTPKAKEKGERLLNLSVKQIIEEVIPK